MIVKVRSVLGMKGGVRTGVGVEDWIWDGEYLWMRIWGLPWRLRG
jgi:hypothetical protein